MGIPGLGKKVVEAAPEVEDTDFWHAPAFSSVPNLSVLELTLAIGFLTFLIALREVCLRLRAPHADLCSHVAPRASRSLASARR